MHLILVAITLGACQKAPNNQGVVDEQTEARATPVPSVKLMTPPPEPVATKEAPAEATPAPNFIAAAGVYFLTTAVSVETADGITGLRPGTRAIKQADGRYLADGHLVELRAEQLTNDTRFAARAVQADQTAQAAIQRRLEAPTPALEAKKSSIKRSTLLDRNAEPEIQASETGQKHVPGVVTQPSGLQTSTALGAGHTRTANGCLWQKTPDGKFWTAVKRLDGKPLGLPPDVPVR